jgi:hypothetical protein
VSGIVVDEDVDAKVEMSASSAAEKELWREELKQRVTRSVSSYSGSQGYQGSRGYGGGASCFCGICKNMVTYREWNPTERICDKCKKEKGVNWPKCPACGLITFWGKWNHAMELCDECVKRGRKGTGFLEKGEGAEERKTVFTAEFPEGETVTEWEQRRAREEGLQSGLVIAAEDWWCKICDNWVSDDEWVDHLAMCLTCKDKAMDTGSGNGKGVNVKRYRGGKLVQVTTQGEKESVRGSGVASQEALGIVRGKVVD